MTTHYTDTPFVRRHIGPSDSQRQQMLETVGYQSVAELLDAAMPASIRDGGDTLSLPPALSEVDATEELSDLASRNQVKHSMIGMGYYGTHTPAVIRRNVFENPAWYTAYTPYQPEISQGRLEALLNFQTMVSDLTGLEIAGASLLDEATAAAEAMTLARRAGKSKSPVFVVDEDTLPQTLSVLRTRAVPLGIDVVVTDCRKTDDLPEEFFGILLSLPGNSGVVRDHRKTIAAAKQRGAQVAVAADLLALTMVRSPGSIGADIAVGSAQRFGVPMGFGGPHAGYMSVRKGLERSLPGRLVGVSRDTHGTPAYRLALQTREQHIRREKATSNICTAQVLLAVMASCYAVYHGPDGLRAIAQRVHDHAQTLAAGLESGGVDVWSGARFDTVTATVTGRAADVVAAAAAADINIRFVDEDTVAVACDETTTAVHVAAVWDAFGVAHGEHVTNATFGPELLRDDDYLTHEVFHSHRSETSMLRYLRRLADFDFALDKGMIPLGSCTMKLNAASQMEPVSWPGFANIHPYAPVEQVSGYHEMVRGLEDWLCDVTGYDAVSLQPNAGSQGELAGLLAIRAYHDARGESHRTVCLIPSSAHGTNAASAIMAGMRVVVVACDDEGNIDMNDLDAKLSEHSDSLAAIMVTYPSTHGVYESEITALCEKVHDVGGQIYVDGANLNALLGFAKPGKFGADVSHLNLHKTFCIPHGGGGPGVGPVAARAHLAPYLPQHPLDADGPVGPVAAAPFGSAGILPIPWMYLRMMSGDGLKEATGTAVLAANYIAARLGDHYPVLYSGNKGLVAHECILDLRQLTKETKVTVDDVAKRLIDYGFHAPTMSFPVAGTLMVEPTESEDLDEIDRFCDAMIAIRSEIDKVGAGHWPADDNPLARAPHTAYDLTQDWTRAYDRETAVYPLGVVADKYWPPVGRIDGAYGDRNLACSCPPPEAFS